MYDEILSQLINKNDTKLVLLILDGLGGTTNENRVTELEYANTPNMDKLA
ncbi:phosphoglycerate mutase, partial [bacterium]